MENQRIRQLPPDVIGQIAAGEVVERPASAIKELIENSIDAGATSVTIDIRDGGITSFKVTDNGKGIVPQDICLAFARHATSKIRASQDIYGVKTLGFRGEALASIAAVSRVTLTTRARGLENGIRAVNEGGVITNVMDTACPEGTTIAVEDLFFNAPVRKKFLKKPSNEASQVTDIVCRAIISHPQISFRYRSDGKNIYFSAGDGKKESAVLAVWGLDTLRDLHRIDGTSGGILLEGFVGTGNLARGNRAQQFFFVNGRMMKSPLLIRAVENACAQRVMIGKFPICMLYLTMPFENVDVNVHPNKWEVRFADERALIGSVQGIIHDCFAGEDLLAHTPKLFSDPAPSSSTPQFERLPVKLTVTEGFSTDTTEKQPVIRETQPLESIKAEETHPIPSHRTAIFDNSIREPLASVKQDEVLATASQPSQKAASPAASAAPSLPSVSYTVSSAPIPKADPPSPVQLPPAPIPAAKAPHLVIAQQQELFSAEVKKPEEHILYIGVVFNTYIIFQYKGKMILCDQHAAHERLLYEKLVSAENNGEHTAQELLVPRVIHLTGAQMDTYRENHTMLQKCGFDAQEYGNDDLCLRGVPVILGVPQAERCFLDAIDELTQSYTYSDEDRLSRLRQCACKHAVKGGENIDKVQLMRLLKDIFDAKIPPTCPHGRPLFIEMEERELEKRFKRIQD